MSRKPSLKPGTLSREELLERRISDLERMVRRFPARSVQGGSDATSNIVQQTTHGLSVGNVIRHNGASWIKSKADTAANSVVGGIVIAVLSPDVFVMATGGYVSGLSGLTAGAVHYLDSSAAGTLTTTAPSIAAPIIHADTTTSGVILSADAPPASYRHAVFITKLTSGTTYTVPSTYSAFLFVLIGGGGGGGEESAGSSGSNVAEYSGGGAAHISMYAHGGGGGGGETAIVRWENRAAVSSLAYAIGAAGAASTNGGDTDITIDSTVVRSYGGAAGAAATVAAGFHKAGKGGLGGGGTGPGVTASSPTNCIVERYRGHSGDDGGINVIFDGTTDVGAQRELASGGSPAYTSDTNGRGGEGSSGSGVPAAGYVGCILVFGLE